MTFNFKSDEIRKLIQFGYDLHKDELDFYAQGCWYVPNFRTYDGMPYYNKRLDKGMVYAHRGYANHSDNTVYTTLGVVMGEHFEDSFKYGVAIQFGVDNSKEKGRVYISLMIPKLEANKFTPIKDGIIKDTDELNQILKEEINSALTFDKDNHAPELTYFNEAPSFDKWPESKQLELFLLAMETLGFNKELVIGVLGEVITAEQAFMAVAPPELVNKRWVNKHRKHFEFEGNTAISGHFGSMELDNFPFPFEGQANIDCAKVKTACVEFGENKKGHKLINVNCNPDSIVYTNLRNAIIEEPIDSI